MSAVPAVRVLPAALLAIDPGTTQSGVVQINPGRTVAWAQVMPNGEVLEYIPQMLAMQPGSAIAIEMIASYGMPVGAEVFETCLWIGRFIQAAAPERVRLVYRRDVKLHLCGSPRAKDPNVRQALIDRWGGKTAAVGTSKAKGPLYEVKSHAWAALAVALTALETREVTA